MSHAFSSPRLLMNQLRQLMAQGEEARDRLDRVVKLIAGAMVADVCSIYFRTEDDQLELIATEGLRPEAVSSTRLALDEGLVGQIAVTAAPLSIQDAPRHPSFSYRPETGEDPYHAFLGVPVLRGGRVTGVLTVQNQTERVYDEDEIETLQTIAMVIAEVIASGVSKAVGAKGPLTGLEEIKGRILCEGLGVGPAHLYDPVVPAAKFFAADQDHEARRLQEALDDVRASVDRMISSNIGALGGDPHDVMEAYRMLAHDPGWAARLLEGVRSGLTAEAAVDRARREHRARLESVRDAYLRDRLHDFEDLDNRLLRVLGGAELDTDADRLKGCVLVARRLGPAELLEFRGADLAAIVLEEAAASSHAAIVAKALDMPTLGGVDRATTHIKEGDRVIVDAERGVAHIRPDGDLEAAYRERATLRSARQAAYAELRDAPSVTKDGVEIALFLNAGLSIDLEHMEESGASGVGLFRTEFQFLVSERLPRVDEQTALYKQVLDAAGDWPVYFRTLDLGADKILPVLSRHREENPALGLRSIRFALSRPGLFRRQLRALIQAAAGRPLWIMFPMVTTAAEFVAAKALLDEELAWADGRGRAAPDPLKVGAMLESPALAFELPALQNHADFVSIGTNDLMQFFHAADRMSPEISDRYDLLARAPLAFLRQAVADCDQLDLPVSVCGEAAGRPLEALALIALGVRRLSMPASAVGPVKQMVRSLDLAAFQTAFDRRLESTYGSFRNTLLALSSEFEVSVGDG